MTPRVSFQKTTIGLVSGPLLENPTTKRCELSARFDSSEMSGSGASGMGPRELKQDQKTVKEGITRAAKLLYDFVSTLNNSAKVASKSLNRLGYNVKWDSLPPDPSATTLVAFVNRQFTKLGSIVSVSKENETIISDSEEAIKRGLGVIALEEGRCKEFEEDMRCCYDCSRFVFFV